MNVIGYDPFLSINAAWSLDHNVQHSETLEGIYKNADYITLHVPQTNDTKGMINASSLKMMKDGVRILNIARGGRKTEKATGKNVACPPSISAAESFVPTK